MNRQLHGTFKEAFQHLSGWNISEESIYMEYINELKAKVLVNITSRSPLEGTISYSDYLDNLNGFLEIDKGFTLLVPKLLKFEGTANTCDKIWSLELPQSFDDNAALLLDVYNYGEVRAI